MARATGWPPLKAGRKNASMQSLGRVTWHLCRTGCQPNQLIGAVLLGHRAPLRYAVGQGKTTSTTTRTLRSPFLSNHGSFCSASLVYSAPFTPRFIPHCDGHVVTTVKQVFLTLVHLCSGWEVWPTTPPFDSRLSSRPIFSLFNHPAVLRKIFITVRPVDQSAFSTALLRLRSCFCLKIECSSATSSVRPNRSLEWPVGESGRKHFPLLII